MHRFQSSVTAPKAEHAQYWTKYSTFVVNRKKKRLLELRNTVILASLEVITGRKGLTLYGNKILRCRTGPNRSPCQWQNDSFISRILQYILPRWRNSKHERSIQHACERWKYFFRWRYSPLWELTCRTIPLHFSLSITNTLNPKNWCPRNFSFTKY
jgi:hypothetical protein